MVTFRNILAEYAPPRAAILIVILLAPSMAVLPFDLTPFDAGHKNRLGLTFSHDGDTAAWTEWDAPWGSGGSANQTIYIAQRVGQIWQVPRPAPFTNGFSDSDPFLPAHGNWLYFTSNRPTDAKDEEPDSNIWRYSMKMGVLEYVKVGGDGEEYSPVVSGSGNLYFAASDVDAPRQGDLYRAPALAGGFGGAEPLGAALNGATGEWNLWVSDDEREVLFEASSRPTNVSVPGDLYYSWLSSAGWVAATSLIDVNTAASELMPRVHPEGDRLLFTRAHAGAFASLHAVNWPDLRAQTRASYSPVLLVANRSSADVSVVDVAHASTVSTIGTGAGPHLLSNVSHGKVIATGYGEFPEPHILPVDQRPPFVESLNSRLTMIDTGTGKVIYDQVLEACSKPHSSWIVGNIAYVSCEDERSVAVVAMETGEVIEYLDTAQDGSHVLGWHAPSSQLAVTNTVSGSLSLLKPGTGERRVVKLAAGSEGLLVRSDTIWVANGGTGSVSVVNPYSAKLLSDTGPICGFPIAFAERGAEEVWLACFGSSELLAISTSDRAVKRRIPLDAQPLNLLLHPSRPLAYVSLPRHNAVAEIDMLSGAELRRIPVGIEPDGLRWATD